ncbi:MAG: hypothetical protein HZB76_07110, partial [Chlamydiae bacterium]|nr:hypothetical protein [Chlamydiota bacterium]
DRKKEAISFKGAYHCEEFGTDWLVDAKEEERGIWGVHMIPFDHRPLADIQFLPRSDESGNLIFQSSYAGRIELTTDGFVYNGGKMAPVNFTKKQP